MNSMCVRVRGASAEVFVSGADALFALDIRRDRPGLAAELARALRESSRILPNDVCRGPFSEKGFAYDDGLDTSKYPIFASEAVDAGFETAERHMIYEIPKASLARFAGVAERVRLRTGLTVKPFKPYSLRADAEKYCTVAETVSEVNRNVIFGALSAFCRQLSRGGCFIAEKDGKPCGALLASREKDILTVRTIVVAPSARKYGAAAALISAAACIEAGTVRAGTVFEGNTMSRPLAENLGGVPVSERLIFSLKLKYN